MTKPDETQNPEPNTAVADHAGIALLDVLAATAYVAFSNTLSGNSTPKQDKYFNRMSNPEVGDLVLETSSIGRAESIDRIGRLISITIEPWGEDTTLTEKIWTIKTTDDRVHRWSNCSFIVIPEHPHNHQAAI